MGQRALRVGRAADAGRVDPRAAELADGVDGQLVLAGADRPVRPHHALLVVGAPPPHARVGAGAAEAALGDEAVGVGAAAACLRGRDCHLPVENCFTSIHKIMEIKAGLVEE